MGVGYFFINMKPLSMHYGDRKNGQILNTFR